MDQENLRRIFLLETEELLTELETGLVALEESPDDPETINRVFRAAHTIKSSAGIVGLRHMVEFTHTLESVLDRVRGSRLAVTHALTSCLLGSLDIIKVFLDDFSQGTPERAPPAYAEILAQLHHYRGLEQEPSRLPTPDPHATTEPRTYRIRLVFDPHILHTGQAPELFIKDLMELGELLEVQADTSRIPPINQMDPHRFYLRWRVILRTRRPRSSIDNVFLFVMDDNPIEIEDITGRYREGHDLGDADKRIGELLVQEGYVASQQVEAALREQKRTGELLVEAGQVQPEQVDRLVKRQQGAREALLSASIRVEVDKLNALMNLVGEMVIAVSRVTALVQRTKDRDSETMEAVTALEGIARDLQDRAMSLRMVPLEGTFSRFRRVVRDLAQELDREVELHTEGTETELDKNVIERLVDPLKHLVRNAVAHGIEPPDERRRQGKPPQGRLTLRASQRAGSIFIEIMDDGRGLDRPRIAARARELGLLDSPDIPPDPQLLPLLFEPGFSTAQQVDEISGRGVGLEVVKRNLQTLRGDIQVESTPGEGTCFRLRLPLTLAIIDTMKVALGRDTLCVPLANIVEMLRPNTEQIKTVEGRGELVFARGQLIPLVRLHRLFAYDDACHDPTHALVVVLESDGRRFGILVDDVLGQEQAVIKSLDTNFRAVPGFSGATILGDGKPSLILDPDALDRLAFHAQPPPIPQPRSLPT